jgi:hypothetical protein
MVKLLSMLSNRVIKAPLLWCLLACLMPTGVVWLLGQRLSGIEFAPDQGASWYYWKLLPHPIVWTHLSAWLEVTWIPIIEYSLVAVIAGLVWIGLKIADAVRSRSGSDSPDLRSPTTAGHSA